MSLRWRLGAPCFCRGARCPCVLEICVHLPLKTGRMKILHTSDWHIGQILNFHYDRQEEHQYFLDQLCEIMDRERPDALIVSGDLYDKNTPSNTAMRFLSDNLLRICDIAPEMPIVLTAGNHDSSSRIESMSGVWKRVNTYFVGAADRVGEDYRVDKHIIEIPDKGWIAAIPYIPDYQNDLYNVVLQEIRERNSRNLPVILMGHTTIGNAIFSAHESTTFNGRDIVGGINSMSLNDIDDDYDYFALGHIHTPQTLSNGKARYCGSPVQLNFKEQFTHSVTMVTLENHGDMPTIETIELEPLRKFYVIPSKPTPLEEALSYLENNLPDSQGYVQLNILPTRRIASATSSKKETISSTVTTSVLVRLSKVAIQWKSPTSTCRNSRKRVHWRLPSAIFATPTARKWTTR